MRLTRVIRLAAGGLALAATLGGAGCQSIPVASLPTLAGIDPFSLDPAALKAAIVHDGDVVFPERSTRLTFTLRSAGEVVATETFVLDRSDGEGEIPAGPDEAVDVFAIAEADRERFEAFQTLLREERDNKDDDGNAFTVSVNARPCLKSADQPLPRAAAYVKSSEKGRFVVVARNLPLSGPEGVGPSVCEDS